VLELLSRKPSAPSELRRTLDVAGESVSRTLRVLLDEGLVSVETSPKDRRIRLYSLTTKGEVELRRQRAFGERPDPPAPRDPQEDREFRQASLRQAIALRRCTNALGPSDERLFLILKRAEDLDDQELALDTLSELVTTLDQEERRQEAKDLLGAIKGISRGTNTDFDGSQALPATAHYHYALGRLAEDQGLRQRASYLNTAIRLYGELAEDPPYVSTVDWRERRAWGRFGLAQNLRAQSFFAGSLSQAIGALQEFAEIESVYGRAQCLGLIGFCLRLLGRFGPALHWLQDAHGLAEENGFERLLAEVQLQRGEVLRCREQVAASRECLSDASDRAKAMKLGVVHAFSLSALGALAYGEEDWSRAHTSFSQADEYFACVHHPEGRALNDRRQATLARRLAEVNSSRDLSSAEGLIHHAMGSYKTLRSPAGLLACEVELGWVRLLGKRGISSTLKTLSGGLDDSETRLLLELDPWVPTVLNSFALHVDDDSLVERSTRLLADSSSRLNELAAPATRECDEGADQPTEAPMMAMKIAEMGGEGRQEVDDGTEVLALAPSQFGGERPLIAGTAG
jgi:DNA-binding MarR family transcriptional regulator